jgi:hypothetical protein
MPNWCNNFIEISGTKSDMKPIYDFFVDSQKKLDEYADKKKAYIKEHPELNMWSNIEGITMEEILVMNTLVPHDEEYKQIEESGEYLVHPQQAFYGTKWDFDFEQANIIDVREDYISLSPSTAWSPPSEFCEMLAKKHNVHIDLQYEEGGVGFVGKEEFTSEGMIGQVFYDDYYEGLYHLDNETFWSMVESELEDLEDITEEEFLNKFPFVSDKDKEQLKQDYQDYKQED